jgi:hypothetical protein
VANLWPWLAVAGLGALHGLNPATGWVFAAARGVRAHDRGQAWRALVPIAAGHAVSVALVAAVVVLGLGVDRATLQVAAGVLLLVALASHLRGHAATRMAGRAGLALWSFVVSTGHGTGLMLVPALVPLCLGTGPVREITASGSLALALAAVAVHTAAMLCASGILATGACRAVDRGAGLLGRWRTGLPSMSKGE